MSLPKHYRETLLSAALDGELTAQEQLDFDREFAADPFFAREFEDLQLLRSELRSSLSIFRDQKISSNATARILAAIEAAETAPASVSNSVPNISQEVSRQLRWSVGTRRVAAVLALAASMLLAVTLWNQKNSRVPVRNSIATLSDVQSLPRPDASSMEAISEQPSQPKSTDVESIASNQPSVADAETMSGNLVSPPKVMSIKPIPNSDLASTSEPMKKSPAQADVLPKSNSDQSSDRTALSVVLVLSVELTDAGRDQHALYEALRATDIRLGEESIMGDNVVSHLRDSKVIDTSSNVIENVANLFFVEASAKRIDRFMSYLMANPESFASVGLSLATDPPLLASVGDLRELDPTKVRQDVNLGIAHGVVSSDQPSLAIDSEYPFIPLSSADIGTGLLNSMQTPTTNVGDNPSSSVVDDFPSQILLLVK